MILTRQEMKRADTERGAGEAGAKVADPPPRSEGGRSPSLFLEQDQVWNHTLRGYICVSVSQQAGVQSTASLSVLSGLLLICNRNGSSVYIWAIFRTAANLELGYGFF